MKSVSHLVLHFYATRWRSAVGLKRPLSRKVTTRCQRLTNVRLPTDNKSTKRLKCLYTRLLPVCYFYQCNKGRWLDIIDIGHSIKGLPGRTDRHQMFIFGFRGRWAVKWSSRNDKLAPTSATRFTVVLSLNRERCSLSSVWGPGVVAKFSVSNYSIIYRPDRAIWHPKQTIGATEWNFNPHPFAHSFGHRKSNWAPPFTIQNTVR